MLKGNANYQKKTVSEMTVKLNNFEEIKHSKVNKDKGKSSTLYAKKTEDAIKVDVISARFEDQKNVSGKKDNPKDSKEEEKSKLNEKNIYIYIFFLELMQENLLQEQE